MNFSLLVLSSPYSHQASSSAIRFAKSCIESGHKIYRVFFYHDGIQNGSLLQTPQQDELNLKNEWSRLSESYDIDLVICIAAALKRGVLNKEEADRYDKSAFNLEPPFELSGLGQLLDAQIHSDRLITFA